MTCINFDTATPVLDQQVYWLNPCIAVPFDHLGGWHWQVSPIASFIGFKTKILPEIDLPLMRSPSLLILTCLIHTLLDMPRSSNIHVSHLNISYGGSRIFLLLILLLLLLLLFLIFLYF